MKKNRIIGIFTAIAIIAAVVVSFAVYTYLNPARGTIYVFNNDYQSGEPVTREILTPVQVDSKVFVGSAGGSINDQFVTGENFSKVVTSGDTLKMNVSKGMPLTPSMLSKIGGSSIEMAMNPQSVAISIPVNNISGVTSDLQSGAVVNLYYPKRWKDSVTTNVSKNGVKTGYTTGKVTALNQAIYYDTDGDGVSDTRIYGLVTSNVYQGQGDSGGVVMIPRTDSNGGAIGLGLLSGGVNMSNTMHFSDLNVLPVALQNRY